jgi:hypothetical protein
MSAGELIVIGLRLVIPLMIFRYNLLGGIVAMLLDGADVIIIDLIGLGGFGGHYHQLDKVLDVYYLSIELLVALRWTNPYTRLPAAALFGFRMVGVVAFEATEARIALFIFPNMFENWWLYCAAVRRFWPRLEPHNTRPVAFPMLALLVPKMGQEYLLHFAEAQPWSWFKDNVYDVGG